MFIIICLNLFLMAKKKVIEICNCRNKAYAHKKITAFTYIHTYTDELLNVLSICKGGRSCCRLFNVRGISVFPLFSLHQITHGRNYNCWCKLKRMCENTRLYALRFFSSYETKTRSYCKLFVTFSSLTVYFGHLSISINVLL